MPRLALVLTAAVAAAAFLVLLKLMYDMTGHMSRMTDQVAAMSADMGRMRAQMQTMVTEVAGIRASVGHMDALATDVHGIRGSVEAMAEIVRTGEQQIRSLNPAEMLQQMVPAAPRR